MVPEHFSPIALLGVQMFKSWKQLRCREGEVILFCLLCPAVQKRVLYPNSCGRVSWAGTDPDWGSPTSSATTWSTPGKCTKFAQSYGPWWRQYQYPSASVHLTVKRRLKSFPWPPAALFRYSFIYTRSKIS